MNFIKYFNFLYFSYYFFVSLSIQKDNFNYLFLSFIFFIKVTTNLVNFLIKYCYSLFIIYVIPFLFHLKKHFFFYFKYFINYFYYQPYYFLNQSQNSVIIFNLNLLYPNSFFLFVTHQFLLSLSLKYFKIIIHHHHFQ